MAELAATVVDLKTNLGKIGLICDKIYCPRWIWDKEEMNEVRTLYNNDFKSLTTTLGLVWDLELDTFMPATNLTIYDNYRGMPGGPPLRDTNLDEVELTRDSLCKIAPQIWDQLGRRV